MCATNSNIYLLILAAARRGTMPVTVHNPDEREKEVAVVVVWGTATDADNLDTWKMNVTLMNRSPPYFISLPLRLL